MMPRSLADTHCECIGQCGDHQHCSRVTHRDYGLLCYWCEWCIEQIRLGIKVVPSIARGQLELFGGVNA